MRKSVNRIIVTGLIAAMLAMPITGGGIAGNQVKAATMGVLSESSQNEASKNASYLKTYFKISLSGNVDAKEFNDALVKIAGKDAPSVSGTLTTLPMIKAAIGAADYEELAISYPTEKVEKQLRAHKIYSNVKDDYARYLACAIDTGLITEEDGRSIASDIGVSSELASRVLMAIVSVNGDGRNYLGESNEPSIYGKIDNMWNSFILYDDAKLSALGKDAVQKKIVTGYNLKNKAYDARFLPELTLQYGHSDIKHAHQLIGLLNSEGIHAKVQLEPKVSIYQYLLEWGPVPKSTPTYEVKKFSKDLYLVYAVEYDMQLEFDNKEDMLAFDGVIQKFAKKYSDNADAKGLIYASWWQPLYSTTVSDMPADAYDKINDCVVDNGNYSLHTFCLTKDVTSVAKKLQKLQPSLKVQKKTRYCNNAFYHYLKGEDYQ